MRTVDWFRKRVQSLEHDFVKHLLRKSLPFIPWERGFDIRFLDGIIPITDEEARLMDDILDLKEWLVEMAAENLKISEEEARKTLESMP